MNNLRMKVNLLVFCLMFIVSCSSLVDEIDLPSLPPPVVVHAYLYPEMDEINVVLRYAGIIGSNTSNPQGVPIENAYVLILSEDGDSIVLNYSHEKKLYTGNSEPSHIEAGRQYFLVINHNDFETIEASTRVPVKHNAFHAVFTDSIIHSYQRDFFVDCYINDNPGTTNYYQLFGDVEGITDCFTEAGLQTESFSRSLFDFSPILSSENLDVLIQPGKFSLPIRTAPDTCIYYPQNINLRLYSIDLHTYKYLMSIEEFSDASDNPFLEPQNTYTNINNGYGIFGAYSVSDKFFEWETLINAQKKSMNP